MRKHNAVVPLICAVFCLGGWLTAFTDEKPTNAPPKVTIRELLDGKAKWNSNRVDVSGFYNSGFEWSILTEAEGQSSDDDVWIDRFHVSQGSRQKLNWVERGRVRVIGT